MTHDPRPTAIVLSDCQGPAIAWIMGQLPALRARYEFKYYESWHRDGPLTSIPASDLERCRLMFYQVAETRPASDVRPGLAGGCRLILFGSPSAEATYPRRGRWPRDLDGRPRCTLHPELADRYAIALFKAGFDRNEYMSRYFVRPVAADIDLPGLHDIDRARWEQADAGIDVKVADFLCSAYQTTKLFHCFDHPTNALYLYQMNKMIDLCAQDRLPGFENPAELAAGLVAIEQKGPASFGAKEFFGEVQTPIDPGVAAALGLRYGDETTKYENRGIATWVHREYIAALYDHLLATVPRG